MNYCYGKGVQKCVLCLEVVPFSEGPLSEVPLIVKISLGGGEVMWQNAITGLGEANNCIGQADLQSML